ncbi:hypothetical protein, partial [uncultured Jannaschia sp.]|uniref:hypothetical protein n=1 Tax=uncultured Jannaschia sp. TaxID=293347 RepID=UPI00260E88A5
WFYRTVLTYSTPAGSRGGGIHHISSMWTLRWTRLRAPLARMPFAVAPDFDARAARCPAGMAPA